MEVVGDPDGSVGILHQLILAFFQCLAVQLYQKFSGFIHSALGHQDIHHHGLVEGQVGGEDALAVRWFGSVSIGRAQIIAVDKSTQGLVHDTVGKIRFIGICVQLRQRTVIQHPDHQGLCCIILTGCQQLLRIPTDTDGHGVRQFAAIAVKDLHGDLPGHPVGENTVPDGQAVNGIDDGIRGIRTVGVLHGDHIVLDLHAFGNDQIQVDGFIQGQETAEAGETHFLQRFQRFFRRYQDIIVGDQCFLCVCQGFISSPCGSDPLRAVQCDRADGSDLLHNKAFFGLLVNDSILAVHQQEIIHIDGTAGHESNKCYVVTD